MKVAGNFVNYNNKNSLGNTLRNKRFQFFEDNLKKITSDTIKILDVGGTESFWINRGYHEKPEIKITLLNLQKKEIKYPNLVSVKGDASDLSEYQENEFDLVFSNSVIEHLFTTENQSNMAREVQRVGKYHYIQTPNRYFFMEPHFMVPFFQFFPKGLKYFILAKTKISKGIIHKPASALSQIEEIQLLSLKHMKRYFPKSKVYKEKFAGMTKSITMYNI